MRLVFLDTGTLGMVANPRGTLRAIQCQRWARDLLAAGIRFFIPEVCDHSLAHLLGVVGERPRRRRSVDGDPRDRCSRP
jgi:hypothetical protein